jgi:hypothetical protein
MKARTAQSKSVAEWLGLPTAKPNKFGAKPRTIDGIRFDSHAEARRYAELKLLEKSGEICDLKAHPPYELTAVARESGERVKIGTFKPDFTYRNASGQFVVEDVKSPVTLKEPRYRRNKKHFEAEWGLRIIEVSR